MPTSFHHQYAFAIFHAKFRIKIPRIELKSEIGSKTSPGNEKQNLHALQVYAPKLTPPPPPSLPLKIPDDAPWAWLWTSPSSISGALSRSPPPSLTPPPSMTSSPSAPCHPLQPKGVARPAPLGVVSSSAIEVAYSCRRLSCFRCW